MDHNDLFILRPGQKRAFNRLQKAHKDRLKSGIFFYNYYGTLGALDKNKINGYDDQNNEGSIQNKSQNSDNEFNLSCNEWSDDTHYFHPNNRNNNI